MKTCKEWAQVHHVPFLLQHFGLRHAAKRAEDEISEEEYLQIIETAQKQAHTARTNGPSPSVVDIVGADAVSDSLIAQMNALASKEENQ